MSFCSGGSQGIINDYKEPDLGEMILNHDVGMSPAACNPSPHSSSAPSVGHSSQLASTTQHVQSHGIILHSSPSPHRITPNPQPSSAVTTTNVSTSTRSRSLLLL